MRLPMLLLLLATVLPCASAADRLRVCATIPDLGSLAREIGGDRVEVTVFIKGGDDPHFIDPRPSFIKALSRAEALIEVGMELEIGWVPTLVAQAGNARIAAGAGRIVAAEAIVPLGVPEGPVDRSQGDVHAAGNPHFMTDPLCGAAVAGLLRDRFSALRPADGALFAANHAAFISRLASALAGDAAVAALGAQPVIDLAASGGLDQELAKQPPAALAGWLGRLRPFAGTKAVADHDQYAYFARRFRLVVVGFLEPKPGLAPTSRHLADVVASMQASQVRLILAAAHTDRGAVTLVATSTGAAVAHLAHQVEAVPSASEYLALIEHNVAAVANALAAAP